MFLVLHIDFNTDFHFLSFLKMASSTDRNLERKKIKFGGIPNKICKILKFVEMRVEGFRHIMANSGNLFLSRTRK